jgi:multicomponent K+:H+ antiporter subunit E
MPHFLRTVLPRPALSVLLLLMWLLLNNSIAFGQILLGCVLAVGIPHLAPRRHTAPLSIKAPARFIAYIGLVLADMIRANFTVARQVLGRNSALKPHFFDVPLDLTHPIAISLFAGTITLTPGTVSCEIDASNQFLRVHALHTDNPIDEIHTLKQRYEARLSQIFQDSPRQPQRRNTN